MNRCISQAPQFINNNNINIIKDNEIKNENK